MKLETARGIFLVAALGVASWAAAAWHEPGPVILGKSSSLHCPVPHKASAALQQVVPDRDLLLFMFSLSQSLSGQK
ncbi:hypothetical protein P8H27_01205 [Pseudomonas sp. sp1636]|uniref:hypothetical protein n=1 Tax=Pseudomonas sp. sp1636 TaxID=3036707 RepID=UPI0025A60977|nr:hypothetical protein [Pseudomonas sp. sp1636]MDM8347523.1 hypothetical protein [Pseudomonas sp. sp1636]